MDGYQLLANAIIIQACTDYRKALKIIKRFPEDRVAKQEIAEIERFFRSSLYDALTKIDGEYLIKKLRKEVGV